jgi:hypothetical protein
MACVVFFMHHLAQPYLDRWDVSYYWKAYEKAAFKIISRGVEPFPESNGETP